MRQQQYKERIPHLLPREARTANKTGTLDSVAHDAAVVWLPNGDWYALTIFVSGLDNPISARERRARLDNAIARLSLLFYQYASRS
jgi:beta-lactamase class A